MTTEAPVPLAEQPTEGEFQIAERLVNHQWGASVRQIAEALRDHRLATLQQLERAMAALREIDIIAAEMGHSDTLGFNEGQERILEITMAALDAAASAAGDAG
jgi:hypothetical protein